MKKKGSHEKDVRPLSIGIKNSEIFLPRDPNRYLRARQSGSAYDKRYVV